MGWNVVREVGRSNEIWVITRANNRAPIECAANRVPMPNVHWAFYDLPQWSRFWKKGPRGLRLYYYLWQIGASLVARRLHREIGFDLMHHVTFGRYLTPSFISLFPVPFIWGPVGGGESMPRSFWRTLSLRGRTYEFTRNRLRQMAEHSPFVRLTARRSAVALATTRETARRLRKLGARDVRMFPHVGISHSEIEELSAYQLHADDGTRFISIGRLIHWKGTHLGLKAFSDAGLRDSEYWIVGNGPERGRLEAFAAELGIDNRVRFWGELSYEVMLKRLSECHVLVHPSMHDSGGGVCLLAMAAGRPVICLDTGGPALQVTETTGFKIATDSAETAIEDLAHAMRRLADDSELLKAMGQAGRERASREYEWDTLGTYLINLYHEVARSPTSI